MTTTYQREGETYRCPRHGIAFDLAASCAQCDADPGAPIDVELAPLRPVAPADCLSTEEIERQLTLEAARIRRLARKYASEKVRTRIGAYSAAKLYDTWLKAMRVVGEFAARREDDAIVREQDRLESERETRRHH